MIGGEAMGISSTLKHFWAALKFLYERSDFGTQEALAAASGVSRSTISEQLSQAKGCSSKVQERLAAAFGYDLLTFLALGRVVLQRGLSPHDPVDLHELAGELLPDWLMVLADTDTMPANALFIPEGRVMWVIDQDKRHFRAGARYGLVIEGERLVARASLMDDDSPCLVTDQGVIKPPGEWGGPWLLGLAVMRVEKLDDF